MATERLFTLEEVNALLPEVQAHLDALLAKKEAHAGRHDALFMHELLHHVESRAGRALEGSASQMEDEMQALEAELLDLETDLAALRALGCVVRNLESGWIDFPGQHHGRSVYFCWHRGESSIQYFHSVGDTSQRHPLT